LVITVGVGLEEYLCLFFNFKFDDQIHCAGTIELHVVVFSSSSTNTVSITIIFLCNIDLLLI